MPSTSAVPIAAPTALTCDDLFDADWYRQRYPGTNAADPWADYLSTGWRRGKDPGPDFDVDWYLAVHVDVRGEPLQHYLAHSDDETLRPNPLFDPRWYRSQYPQAADWPAFAHYVRHGRAQGLYPGPSVAAVAATATPSLPLDDTCPSVTVIVEAGSDFIHADRCVRALAATELAGHADVVVIVDPKVDRPWHLLAPSARVASNAPTAIDTDLVLLLRGDTEPLPGMFNQLQAALHESTTPVVPTARATLVAPAIPSDLPRLVDLRLPPQAVLMDRSQWPMTLAELRDRNTVQVEAGLLSHRPMAMALTVKETVSRWDPEAALGIILLATELDRPVALAALRAWLATAGCDVPAAASSLVEWRDELAALPRETEQSLNRLFRRRDQLVADVIQEALLQPEVTSAAAVAIASGDPAAARAVCREHPESYPAAVAMVTLRPASDEREIGSQIPHSIVQGWFDSAIPQECLALTRTWQREHPTWTHQLFDTESATSWISSKLGHSYATVFRSATGVGKSNLFRYAYLSECGGVWSDTDDRCIRSVEPLMRSWSLVVGQETIGAVADNFIAVAPRHPVLIATREEAFANVRAGFGESPWLANGPAMFTRHVGAWLAGDSQADCRILTGTDLSTFVAMHEPVPYKETALAWDVPEPSQRIDDHWGMALSDRQRRLRRHSRPL